MKLGDIATFSAYVGPGRFRHSETNDVVTCNQAFMWTFIFGSFYFLLKGVYKHAIISLALAVFTGAMSWFIYPFFAKGIMTNYYLEKGYHLESFSTDF